MRLRDWMLGLGIALVALGPAACGGVDETGLVGLEDCINGIDDNGDGLADCADPQCEGHAYCLGYRELNCTNGADDDGDGPVDCADPDCQQDPDCHPEVELACADGLDNDRDGLFDCDDPDCNGSDACGEKCGDGIDNDGDGLVDCDDDQCIEAPNCRQEDCANGVDDDDDGDTDCADADCAEAPDCAWVERCDDGIDNDGDGDIDCADDDCLTNPWCTEILCADGVDNDENGLVDCDDPSCAGRPGCVVNTTCAPAEIIYCDYLTMQTTVGRLNNLDTYECVPGTFPGGERYFRLGVFPGTEVSLWLSDYSAGQTLQMVVLVGDESNPGCDLAGDCAAPTSTGGAEQVLTLSPSGYVNVYIVVDSNGVGGDFDLYVSCSPLVETQCNDGDDNDSDGDTDCDDSDCWLTPHCAQVTEVCYDGLDNDGDGLTDCADEDCNGDLVCTNAESMCHDGTDNDGDGDVDCADPDCWLDSFCAGGETSCANGVDDDGDLDVDCWDWDCVGNVSCDWWFDFDEPCESHLDCGPPDHFCASADGTLPGFCSKPCSTAGVLDGDCDTGISIQGFCVPASNGTGHLCIMPCGAAYPGLICPPTWTCVAPDPTFPAHGVCMP